MKQEINAEISLLEDWEKKFNNKLKLIKNINCAGSLLSLIPEHGEWDDFLDALKPEWETWKKDFEKYPCCLIVFLCGVAFYDYDDNTFWPNIAKSLTLEQITLNQQGNIKKALYLVAQKFGLEILNEGDRVNFIGSVIRYIGIPLSMWENFLELCEWASWQDNLKGLSESEWIRAVERCTRSRQRIKRFLTNNRDLVSGLIKEMLDARDIKKEDDDLTIDGISEMCFVRNEYFDEVPETAAFLCPQYSDSQFDSLFRKRPRLMWDDRCCQFSFYLPAVDDEKLPATWRLGSRTEEAGDIPVEMIVNSSAINKSLTLELKSQAGNDKRRILGVDPYALFDLGSGGRMVNLRRHELPIGNYAFISKEPVEILHNDGLAFDESPVNECVEMKDGGSCFVTKLWPTRKFAEFQFKVNDEEHTLKFRTRLKVEAFFLAGENNRSANFTRLSDKVKIEHFPVFCVTIPNDYFRDTRTELENKFKVYIDDRLAEGEWEEKPSWIDNDKTVYKWDWSPFPLIEKIESKTGRLQDLTCKGPNLRGDRLISIKSPNFYIQYKIFLDSSRDGVEKCWENLPGNYILWFVLCQLKEGSKWEELMLIKDIISPKQRISYYMLKKYAEQELIEPHGRRWVIKESRAVIKSEKNVFMIDYCGDPSILWGLYRCMSYESHCDLPVIEIIEKRGELPFLRMEWNLDISLSHKIVNYLNKNNVKVTNKLWIH